MIKYYEVSYKKKIGGRAKLIVRAANKKGALQSAKAVRFTGSDFKILREIEKPKNFKRERASGPSIRGTKRR